MTRIPKVVFIVCGLVLVLAIGWSFFLRGDPIVNWSNYNRIEEGMAFEEVKAILGNPGPSYSSDRNVGYYIWKGKSGWIYIFVEKGKVTSKTFRPE
jgi:hypothetical protein